MTQLNEEIINFNNMQLLNFLIQLEDTDEDTDTIIEFGDPENKNFESSKQTNCVRIKRILSPGGFVYRGCTLSQGMESGGLYSANIDTIYDWAIQQVLLHYQLMKLRQRLSVHKNIVIETKQFIWFIYHDNQEYKIIEIAEI